MKSIIKRPFVPVPRLPEEWERAIKSKPMLNDEVEHAHMHLFFSNDLYAKYMDATWDSQAVEGSLAADNIKAAEVIRTYGKDQGNELIASQNLATLSKSLGVVLRRYNQDRTTRRNTVAGEVAQPNNDESNEG